MPTATARPARPEPAGMPEIKPRRRPPWWRLPWWPAVAGVAVILAGGMLYAQLQGTEQQRDDEQAAKVATAQQAVAVANPVLDYCAEQSPVGQALRADPRNPCGLAQQVVATPVPTPPPPPRDGTNGQNGQDGRGIAGTDVDDAGHLIVTFTDGTTRDVGKVVGRDGDPGRGIAGSDVTDGRLVLTYTDGQRVDLGPVVGKDGTNGTDGTDGKDGRGIASVAQVDSRLVITFTDGTTQDVGPLPVAPPAEPAPQTAMWCPPGEMPHTVDYGVAGPSGTACVTDTSGGDGGG